LSLNQGDFLKAVFVAVVVCLLSAFIGAIGATVGGKPFAASLIDPGVGWFVGDTVSAILGLYLLPLYTVRLREAGIAE
jgi:integral membrane sensor domain MASE1